MKKSILYILLLVGSFISFKCQEYVEIDQPMQRTLTYTGDYQYLLNYVSRLEKSYFYPELASDDIEITDETFANNVTEKNANVYIWAENIYGDSEDTDWNTLYQQIYTANEVINGVLESEGGTEAEKEEALAQAKVHRAFAYFSLVNVYAKQYDAATASTDLGVPLLLTPDLFVALERASVARVYEQIITDLEEAVDFLPETQKNSFLPSSTGAIALLARVQLQIGDYEKALSLAEEALSRQSGVNNLENYIETPTSYPGRYEDQEIILLKTLGNTVLDFPLSQELLDLFDEKDLRYELFTAPGTNYPWSPFEGRGYWKPRLRSQGIYIGPSVPEMMLIQAECLARTNNPDEAISVLNTLRSYRFKAADYQELETQANVLQEVLDERRRETFGTGLRWLDLKRLNKEPEFKTITRTFRGDTYTLEPNSNAYVFQINPIYIQKNPEIESNPR
ncbi:RagB/SusD family nutrient uptake outer membrane protein [Leeuwenhoekiella polynyae]|uniref:SusD-like starch-binding protein associating with outer membrane n=1 Tax=Leeuwenhoekiella polynyae TaxID=1550906 RepID=A0A4Q0NWQ9_9FLAO|nr:RagB/SusD family nutrient uptake outer membrane protein [Leeuwenhoekiella polynyae]RXG15776.1 SusD-like starch-binding protein associating with outer membrane [Leeuwenhoekiella polynyae]